MPGTPGVAYGRCAKSLRFPMVLHNSDRWFCMIDTSCGGGFFWQAGYLYWQVCQIIAFCKDFQGFAEFMWLNGLSPAKGRYFDARCAKSLLFPIVSHDSYSIRGLIFSVKLIFYWQMCRIIAFSKDFQGFAEFMQVDSFLTSAKCSKCLFFQRFCKVCGGWFFFDKLPVHGPAIRSTKHVI